MSSSIGKIEFHGDCYCFIDGVESDVGKVFRGKKDRSSSDFNTDNDGSAVHESICDYLSDVFSAIRIPIFRFIRGRIRVAWETDFLRAPFR